MAEMNPMLEPEEEPRFEDTEERAEQPGQGPEPIPVPPPSPVDEPEDLLDPTPLPEPDDLEGEPEVEESDTAAEVYPAETDPEAAGGSEWQPEAAAGAAGTGATYPAGAEKPEPFTPQPLSPAEERTWAMLAHLSVLVNLVTGFLGPVVALIIYFMYKDRSRYVAYQSMQSFIFQMVWWIGGGVLAAAAWTISGILAVVLIGCLLMPLALLISAIPLAALVYGVIGAVETNQGKDFRYWLIGDWTEDMVR